MKYEYFISYAIVNGFGKCGVVRSKRIRTMTDISEIQDGICEEYGYNVSIINYKLIRMSLR